MAEVLPPYAAHNTEIWHINSKKWYGVIVLSDKMDRGAVNPTSY
jgi:hypothetical protein